MSNDIIWVFSLLFLLIISKLSLQLPTADNWCKLTRFLEYYSNLNNRVHQTEHHQRDHSERLDLKWSSQNPNLNPINHPLQWPQHVCLMVYIHLNRTCGRLKECSQIQVCRAVGLKPKRTKSCHSSWTLRWQAFCTTHEVLQQVLKQPGVHSRMHWFLLNVTKAKWSSWSSDLSALLNFPFNSLKQKLQLIAEEKVELKTRFLFVFELEPLHLCCLPWLRVRGEV